MWERNLQSHPDRDFRQYVVEGIRNGFRIGFDYSCRVQSATGNMQSVRNHPQLIADYLAEECAMGRILGPFERDDLAPVQVHISRFGLIPKKTPGEWRLIIDLSSSDGASVNDGVYSRLCSLQYVTVEEALQEIIKLGRGTWMAKVDIRKAYRNVPVHPHDRWLLGMQWGERIYVDGCLPFGLRSAPKIFTAIADAVEWAVREAGVQHVMHYLDDFLLLGSPGSDQECKTAMGYLLAKFAELGLPVAPSKLEGPATCLSFLGIEIDSEKMEVRLPQEKLANLKELVASWLGRRSCSRQELQSLVGSLNYASFIVKPGKTFMRRLFELLSLARRSQHRLRINTACRSDLFWWHSFLAPLNRASFFRVFPSRRSQFEVFTDASGSFGCGAIWVPCWFQVEWTGTHTAHHKQLEADSITFKEVLPIVWALAVWGPIWRGGLILVHCDNQGAVAAVNAGYSKSPRIMHVLRCLFFIRARFDLEVFVVHVPGAVNTMADAISRNNLHCLYSQMPSTFHRRTQVPHSLQEVLLNQNLDWTSHTWRELFLTCFQPV